MSHEIDDNKVSIIDTRKLQRFWSGWGPNLRERFIDIETHFYPVLKAKGSHADGSVFIIVVSLALFAGEIM